MARESVTIGTRGSQLALAQAEWVSARLREAHPGLGVELQIIQTKGDVILDRALSRIGDKGLFVTEIESALAEGRVDLAVHSCKDLPSETPEALVLASFPARADARDVLVSRHGHGLGHLPHGARIGTSSLRRACQLRAFRPDFDVVNLRGNVDTRLRKAATADYDAVVLAAAGLERLGRIDAVTEFLDPQVMLPAVAQGALAVECRAEDQEMRQLLAPLDDAPTRAAVLAERAFLRRLEGGCQVPIAAYATISWDRGVRSWGSGDAGPVSQPPTPNPQPPAPSPTVHLRGLVGTADGTQIIRGERHGLVDQALSIGVGLAEELLAQGADRILERLSRAVPAITAPEGV